MFIIDFHKRYSSLNLNGSGNHFNNEKRRTLSPKLRPFNFSIRNLTYYCNLLKSFIFNYNHSCLPLPTNIDGGIPEFSLFVKPSSEVSIRLLKIEAFKHNLESWVLDIFNGRSYNGTLILWNRIIEFWQFDKHL